MQMVEAVRADAFTATFSALRTRLQAQIDAPNTEEADALRLNGLWGDSQSQCGSNSDGIRAIASPPALLLASLAAKHPDTLPSKSLASYTRVPTSVEAIHQSRRRLNARREQWRQRVLHVQTAMDAVQADQLQRLTQSRMEFEQHAGATHANALRRLQALFVECIAEMSKAVERARHASSRQTTSDEQQLHEQMHVLERDLQWRWFLTRLEEDTRHTLRTRLLLPDAHETFSRSELSHTLTEIARVIACNGPVLDLDEHVVVDTLVAVGDTETLTDGNTKPLKGKPSLHFVESMAAAWMEVVQQHAPPARPASGGTFSRKPRRPSPTLASSTPVLFTAKSSSLRQIIAPPANQLSTFPTDTPLSCSGIAWLLGVETSRRLFNSIVYVATKDVASDTGRHVVVDAEGTSFVRATVRELLQTRYFQDEFLPLLAHDKELLDQRFPAQLVQQRSIAELFIATVGSSSAKQDAQVLMQPLDTTSLRELCVLFIARGAHTKKPGSRTIASLATADALSVLPIAAVASKDTDEAASSRFCFIRFPRALLRSLGSTPDASWVQKCPTIFIKYHIEVKRNDVGVDSASTTVLSKRQKAMALLGSICSWRSCLDEATHTIAPNGVRVCGWHKLLQTTLDDWTQFTPSLKELKASLKATEDQSETETVKKLLLQSSSLLQELTSRQLGQSITTFLAFTKHAVSNAAFEENAGYEFEDTETEDEQLSVDEDTVNSYKTKLVLVQEVLSMEQSITAMIRTAKKHGCSMQELQTELREFDVDIQTDNYELIRELSRRKLAILQRRMDENGPERAFGAGKRRLMHSISDAALMNGPRATLGHEPQLRYANGTLQLQQRGSNSRHLLI